MPRVVFLLCCLAAVLPAQTIEVYSEFQRFDAFGRIAKFDGNSRPREILSPAIARNAYTTYWVVVTVPEGMPFALHIGQNPENAVRTTLYKQIAGGRLKPVTAPYEGALPDAEVGIDGQTTAVFLLDCWTDGRAPVRRIKLEPQLYANKTWYIYPMEVRVTSATVPGVALKASVDLVPQNSSLEQPLQQTLCGGPLPPAGDLIRRNALQDAALARRLETKLGQDELQRALLGFVGAADAKAWCAAPAFPKDRGPEWYLRVRDYLYRTTAELFY
jgi:hypothetical protein